MADKGVASPPTVKKKLPFKPTALRRLAAPKPTPAPTQPDEKEDEVKESDDDDGLSLFQRSREMASIITADRERQLKRHQKHQMDFERRIREAAREKRPREQEEEEEVVNQDEPIVSDDIDPQVAGSQSSPARPRSSEVAEQPATQDTTERPSELVTPPPSKRSRLSSSSSSKKHIPALELDDPDDDEPFPDASPTPFQRKPSTPSRAPKMVQPAPAHTNVISIDSDSDSDNVSLRPSSIPASRRSTSMVDLVDRTSSRPSPREPSPKEPSPPPEEDEFAEYVRKAKEQRERDQALLQRGLDGKPRKEFVDILIMSQVPNTRPLKLKYLFDKPFRLARETWSSYQNRSGVSIPVDDVILTWRKKKIYNTSTLLSLGIRPQGEGRVIAEGQGSEGFEDSRAVVNVEAWTPELFQEMERNEELRRRREAGDISEEDEDQEEPAEDVKLKVMLKSRDLEDLRLTIRPETTVETLVTCFRAQRKVDPDKQVGLWWDGDRLEEHVTMEEAEIEDMDTLEVYIQ
ncbi:hypothetical protein N0V84_002496 [Fusarium piperis]|uniref:Ubiquitin-like domain-containing protein n=1 Tax=Fusarium piperis TaxID=1435070 RepID=A0A9W9BTC7_9HYPO|nr:hypothetical protein N0V84_002496 [Fusarium piperis]